MYVLYGWQERSACKRFTMHLIAYNSSNNFTKYLFGFVLFCLRYEIYRKRKNKESSTAVLGYYLYYYCNSLGLLLSALIDNLGSTIYIKYRNCKTILSHRNSFSHATSTDNSIPFRCCYYYCSFQCNKCVFFFRFCLIFSVFHVVSYNIFRIE